jgi:hypothetical protein
MDTRSEQFLQLFGCHWSFNDAMRLDMMTSQWDTENLGRSQAKVAAAVADYGKLMDSGSAAPAPILWRNPKTGKYHVLDGIQRLLAEESRRPTTFSAYIVETDSEEMVKKIRCFANIRLQGGYQDSNEWTLERIVVLLVIPGIMTVEEAAEHGGWTIAAVRNKKQAIELRQAIRNAGGPERLPDNLMHVVAKHAEMRDFKTAPSIIAQFFTDVQKAKFTAEEAEPHIADFFRVSRGRKKVFEQFKRRLDEFRGKEDVASRLVDPSKKRRQSMTPEGKLIRALKAALGTAEALVESRERVPDMTEAYQIVNKIRGTLKQLENLSRKR